MLAALDASAIVVPGADVRVVRRCGSTNTELMREDVLARPVLLAAETQTAGRGRRGRRWHAVPGRSIAFSIARRIVRPARELTALPRLAGVAAAQALRGLGARAIGLKWPNDLVVGRAKLGGILVETRGGADASLAVIGIGLNYLPDPGLSRRLRRPVAALAEILSPLPDRNAVIAAIAAQVLRAVERFEREGRTADYGAPLRPRSGLRPLRPARALATRVTA